MRLGETCNVGVRQFWCQIIHVYRAASGRCRRDTVKIASREQNKFPLTLARNIYGATKRGLCNFAGFLAEIGKGIAGRWTPFLHRQLQ